MAENFNPYGLHAIRIPLALVNYDGATATCKSLSWGAKVFYALLAFHLGRPKAVNFCCPGMKMLVKETGASTDTIGRWLNELIDHGFLQRVRRGRQPEEFIFLPHPVLKNPPEKPASDSAELRNQHETLEPQSCGGDSADPQFRYRNSAAPTPQNCGSPISEENVQENVHQNVHENVQHHQRDDAACAPMEEEVLELAGVRKNAANLRELRKFVSAGVTIEQIRGGVALGRLRHMSNAGAPPIVSFRFFRNPIADAVEKYSEEQLEHTIRRLKRELSRQSAEPDTGNYKQPPAEEKAAPSASEPLAS